MASDLVNSCMEGVLPTIQTISKYGLDGHKGTNPIDIFKCYCTAVQEGKISAEDITKTSDINSLILNYNKSKDYYSRVKKAGGIQISVKLPDHIECPHCKFCGISPQNNNICSNCQLKF